MARRGMANNDHVAIEILAPQLEHGLRWAPTPGKETQRLLEQKVMGPRAREAIRQEAMRVLGHCVPPTERAGTHTELVVGYVQSGKTLSFTTVAALANDNGYRVIIVVSGTAHELANQSRDRLDEDLAIETAEISFPKWVHIHNPGPDNLDEIRAALRDWESPFVPSDDRRVVLLTILKHYQHVQNLAEVLRLLGRDAHVPALIIDDEADQASLNNLVSQRQLSTTYRCLSELRQVLRHHSFLQYTATPQAILLINLIDVLSPDTCTVLEPGENYVGGEVLVGRGSPYVRIIPNHEIPTRDYPLHEPPGTLLEALRLYFLGVASHLVRRDRDPDLRNRSMMVHPSRRVISHHEYYRWVRAIVETWQPLLSGGGDLADREVLLAEFEASYRDLRGSVGDLEPFETLRERLPLALQRTLIRELNHEAEIREIPWRRHPYWILVGGTVLDRGFTLNGLTVTYMPRGPGVGNADTIQQRARFLGYKRRYIGFCRVFLEQAVANAYQVYADHEQDIRQQLSVFAGSGERLSQLRRIFICDRALRPTRKSVIDIEYRRPGFQRGWFAPRHPPETERVIAENRECAGGLTDALRDRWEDDQGDDARTPIMRHRVATGVPLQWLFDEFLSRFQVGNIEDDRKWIVALFLIDRYLSESPEVASAVFHMSAGQNRRRQVNNGRILNLFQGPHPDAQGAIYPGDRQIHAANQVTVQLHNVSFTDGPAATGRVLLAEVPVLTLWMPPSVTVDVIQQDQGGVNRAA